MLSKNDERNQHVYYKRTAFCKKNLKRSIVERIRFYFQLYTIVVRLPLVDVQLIARTFKSYFLSFFEIEHNL